MRFNQPKPIIKTTVKPINKLNVNQTNLHPTKQQLQKSNGLYSIPQGKFEKKRDESKRIKK